jgi:hypothetical protein
VRWSLDFGQVAKLGPPERRMAPNGGQADAILG